MDQPAPAMPDFVPENDRPVHPDLVAIFDTASQHMREGRFPEALAEFNRLMTPEFVGSYGREGVTPEFLGVTNMRRGMVLMEMQRFNDARETFEMPLMNSFLPHLRAHFLFEFMLAHGFALGMTDELKAMDDRFNRALGIAATELADPLRCELVFDNIYTLAIRLRRWDYLLSQSGEGIEFARNNKADSIMFKSVFFNCLALFHLGETDACFEGLKILADTCRETGQEQLAANVDAQIAQLRQVVAGLSSQAPEPPPLT